MLGLPRVQRSNGNNPDNRRCRNVCRHPTTGRRHVKRAGTGQKRPAVPAIDGDCRTRPVFMRFQGFNTVGVNRDILCGRQKRHQQRADSQGNSCSFRILRAHRDHHRHQQHLAAENPRTALPEPPAKARQPPTVDQRRPQKINGIGRRYRTDNPDRCPRYTFFAQPDRQGREDKRRGQATRHAKEKNCPETRIAQPRRPRHLMGIRHGGILDARIVFWLGLSQIRDRRIRLSG